MRALALSALLIAVIAVLYVVSGNDSREYSVKMQNAGQLVPGDLVRIGGIQAGSVKSLDLTDDGQAIVRFKIDKSWGRLHSGSTVTVRASGIATVTGRYVDISPGPSFRPALADGASIDIDHSQPIVDIDQLLNAFDPSTRKGLSHVLHGFSVWYDGRAPQAQASARYFAPALQSATKLFEQIGRDSGTLEEFLQQTGKALGGISRNREQLTALVSNTRATARALGSDNESLSQALVNLPPALREGSAAFADVRPALRDLRALVIASDPASRKLEPFLRDLQPVISRAVPVFRDFRLTFDRPANNDDLLDALQVLPALGKLSDRTFPQAEKTLGDSEPVLSFIRPYAPELIGFARSFGSATATYDANGHYARTVPVFDAFTFTDDAAGGTLTPKTAAEKGKSPYLTGGHTRRCPGGGAPATTDGSAPFKDNGALANPDCDPADVIK